MGGRSESDLRGWFKPLDFVKRFLTVKRGKTKEEPSKLLLIIVYFGMSCIAALTLLEIIYMIIFRSWNSEIFAALTALIGNVTGIFISRLG